MPERSPSIVHRRGWSHLYPFRSHTLDIDGLAYHYLDEGQGDPVLMVHGNPTWSFYFRALVGELAPDWRCVVPDHIGCGLSAKPTDARYRFTLDRRVADLERLCDHLALTERLTLVVHDWGGMIGLAWALRHPTRIARLVILNTAGFPPPAGKPVPRRLRLIRDFPALAEPAVLGLNLFARGAVWMAPRRRLSTPVRQGLLAPYDRPRHRLATLRFVQDIPLGPGDPAFATVGWVDNHLHRLRDLPTLICWGAHDFVFDRDYLAEWRRRFPHAEVHLLENAGHYVLEDAPRTVCARIAGFLQRHPPTGAPSGASRRRSDRKTSR